MSLKKVRNFFLLAVVLCFFSVSFGQNYKKIKPYDFYIGIHWNIVDDNGERLKDMHDAVNVWNMQSYPSSINFDYYFAWGWSAEALASYNYMDSSKIINGATGREGHFFSFDLNAKYNFGFFMEKEIFNPFAVMGVSYTGRETLYPQSMLGINAGGGFDIMIYEGLGVQWRSTAKVGVVPEFFDVEGDYLQHHFGIIYKFPEDMFVSNPFSKKKYGWIHRKPRFRKTGGM